jgi:hypothetical protein
MVVAGTRRLTAKGNDVEEEDITNSHLKVVQALHIQSV